MPKKISSLPTGAINKTDNLITASSGSDELKRNTVDELLAEPNADISALQTENEELKAQITEMEEQISELNSNLTQVTTGNGVRNSDYVSSETFQADWMRCGKVVAVNLTLLMTQTANSIEIRVVTDLPKPVSAIQIHLLSYENGSANVRLNTSGNITVWYAHNLTSGGTYRGSVAYITSD